MTDSLAWTIDGSRRRGVMGDPPSAPDSAAAFHSVLQPLPAGPHLLPGELTWLVLVQRFAGHQCMLARHRPGSIEIEQVELIAVDQVHERAPHLLAVYVSQAVRLLRDRLEEDQ